MTLHTNRPWNYTRHSRNSAKKGLVSAQRSCWALTMLEIGRDWWILWRKNIVGDVWSRVRTVLINVIEIGFVCKNSGSVLIFWQSQVFLNTEKAWNWTRLQSNLSEDGLISVHNCWDEPSSPENILKNTLSPRIYEIWPDWWMPLSNNGKNWRNSSLQKSHSYVFLKN